MKELQVTVKQTPGVITWNFDELKNELAAQMDVYKAMTYTDANIGDAKSDVASLRKLKSAVNARKVEIKNKCLEPYAAIEAQAKELICLIDDPISLIDKKVKEYEARRKAEKKKKITDYMSEAFATLPADIRERLKCKVYDSRWENVTASEKTWKEAVLAARKDTENALKILESVDEDYRDTVMAAYKVDLNFTAAMTKAQELQKQKERVLERERMRREQELRRKEQELMEQKQRQQAGNMETAETEQPSGEVPKTAAAEPERTVAADTRQAETAEDHSPATAAEDRKEPWRTETVILFYGTYDQLMKVAAYIKYVGADYQLRRGKTWE